MILRHDRPNHNSFKTNLTYDEVLTLRDKVVDFIKRNRDDDDLVAWDILIKEFNESDIETLLETGYIYEPILGCMKEV